MKYVYMQNFLIMFGKRKVNIILLIFSFIVLFILMCHLFCGCSKMSFLETFEIMMKQQMIQKKKII